MMCKSINFIYFKYGKCCLCKETVGLIMCAVHSTYMEIMDIDSFTCLSSRVVQEILEQKEM